MSPDSPDDDSLEQILVEALDIDFEEDLQDPVEQELERLLLEATASETQIESTLLRKLALFPDGNFPVSKYSMYGDLTWIIFKDDDGTVIRVTFDNLSEHMRSIKKSIMYHLIPEFAPFAGIRAYSTTRGHSQKFGIIMKYVLIDNHLTGDAESLSFITPKLLNNALDRAREAPTYTHYHYLFLHIRFWISLSVQQLIPVENRINVSATTVDTPERKKDVVQHFTGSLASWEPFTEGELKKLVKYAFFWTDKAMPCLQKVADYAQNRGLFNNSSMTITVHCEPDSKYEEDLNSEVDGVVIVKVTTTTNQYHGSSPTWHYSWINSARHSLNFIRGAIYILVALVTGLRVSELEALKFEHVIEEKNGRFKLQVTRYKTSQDPNYKGDTSFIPLPKFIGRKIKEYEKVRNSLNSYREGFLFQSVIGTRKVTRRGSIKVESITKKLEAELEIGRIHTHRFRKTIAEILINRNERNVDIIRLLFGHASYAMTLRYIGRNPYIVKSVAQAIEQNYIEEFIDIITSVKTSSSSGESAQRLLDKIAARPDAFSGKQLRVTIFTYVAHLLSSGEPLFIHRTAVGTFCVSTEVYSSPSLPPCLAYHKVIFKNAFPDPLHCDPACPHAIIVGKATKALEDNLTFYEQMLAKAGDTISETSKAMIRQKILDNSKHLDELNKNQSYKIIPSVDIQA
ncbi:tyrosine-type recombinase/integrase [Pseudomonas mohnii]